MIDENAVNWFVMIAAGGLFITAVAVLRSEKKANQAWTFLGAAIILTLILCGSRYKNFKGPFGFEVNAYEQTEKHAQELVDRLAFRTEVLTKQITMLVTRAGMMDSSLTNQEMVDIMVDNGKTLDEINISKAHQNELFAPMIDRIKKNYFFMAQQIANLTIVEEMNLTHAQIDAASKEQQRLGKAPDPDPIILLNAK